MYRIPEELLTKLRHPDKNVRNEAIRDLSQIDDRTKLPVLIDALQAEPDLFVRENITYALVQTGRQALKPLADLLKSPDAKVRKDAAHVISKLRAPEAIPDLLSALDDTDPDVLAKVIFALGQIGDSQPMPRLVGFLGHPSVDVRNTLTDVLARFGDMNLLLPALNHEDWHVREHAVDVLGFLRGGDVVPALIQKLDDASVEVRMAVLTALSHVGTVAALQTIHAASEDADSRMRDLARRLRDQAEPLILAPTPDVEYHHVQFANLNESAAFIAALSRVLNSPAGSRQTASELWICREERARNVNVYLNRQALDCTIQAFGQPNVVGTYEGRAITGECSLLFGHVPLKALGMEDAKRILGKILIRRTQANR